MFTLRVFDPQTVFWGNLGIFQNFGSFKNQMYPGLLNK